MICLSVQSTAQTWFSEDHLWQYEFFHGWTPNLDGLYTLQVTGDTVIQGVDCKVVSHSPKTDNYPEDRYAYEEGEAAYLYGPYDDEFHKIYDFSLGVGDSVAVWISGKYFIDSVGTVQVDWEDKRFQIVHLGSSSVQYFIIEGIGFVGSPGFTVPNLCSYIFPSDDFCSLPVDGRNIHFRCFTDGEVFLSPYFECSLPTANEELIQEKPTLFPNPVSGLLQIDSPSENPITEMQVFSLQGESLDIPIFQTNQLVVSHLAQGIYFLKIKFRNGETLTEKIIVAR